MSASSIFSAINKLRSLLGREEKFKLIKIIGFTFCTSILELLTAAMIVVFAQIMNQPEVGIRYVHRIGFTGDLAHSRIVLYMAIVVGVAYLIKNIVAATEVFYQNFVIQDMNYNFKNRLLHRYAEADYGLYLTRNSSLGMQVISGDVEQMFSTGMTALVIIVSESIVFVFLIAMIIAMNPSVALAVFGLGLIFAALMIKIMLPQYYKWGKKLQHAAIYSGQNLMQFFHAFKEIVLFGKRDTFVNNYQFFSRKKTRVQALQTAFNALPRMLIEVLFVGLFVTTIAILCFEDESSTKIIGILGGYLYAGFRLMPGLNRIINQLNCFKLIMPCIEVVHKEYNSVWLKDNYIDLPGFTFNKEISINNVTFCYPNVNKDALTNIDMKIMKGECIGIVGETGSGKSTFVDVMLGLLKPHSGNILIDDQFSTNALQWHKLIGYVPQSIYLIDDTIEANIAFGELQVDDNKLTAAINAAQLSKLIENLPEGIKTLVGERGVRLSGGERQRVAIARALYRDPSVLIFDEATSALDNETEAKLMETIYAVSQNRTVIMVAHRLTTLKNCNRIITLHNGFIKQITDYTTLLNIGDKKYG